MCGIAGVWFKHLTNQERIESAEKHFRDRLMHRGPDAFGSYQITGQAVFVNLRLAIVDRGTQGNQPFFSSDRKSGIVYNGEVYNWGEIRKSLEAKFPFVSQTDTEAVLANYVVYGAESFKALNGMFALCIWDEEEKSFVLARDRFGSKPLYVYEDDECIAFASELRTLLGLEGLDLSPDEIGIQDYLTYRYNLAPRTLFKNIHKIQAGHFVQFVNGVRTQSKPFAEIKVTEPSADKSISGYVEELDTLLSASVRRQLMGDVPIGILLSGGLDSSAIAAYIHQQGSHLKAYSIGFPEVNEFQYSRAVSQRFGFDYREILLTQQELRSGLDTVLDQLDEPIADPACFALSKLCEHIKKDVTVVLSGEGSDELFAGYRHHQMSLSPSLTKDQQYSYFFQGSSNNFESNSWLLNKSLPLHHLRYRRYFDDSDTVLSGMQNSELHSWLPENLMMKADKITMAHSLEGRFPFLDNDIFSFASSLPRELKIPKEGSSKFVLRQLMERHLPEAILSRPKMGFTVPPSFLMSSLRGRLLASLERLRHSSLSNFLDLDEIKVTFLNYYKDTHSIPAMRVWNLAVLLLWWDEVLPRYSKRSDPPSPMVASLEKGLSRINSDVHYIFCDGGLSNRLNTLIFGLILRERFGGHWKISWPVNNWCGAKFHDLFECDLAVDEKGIEYFKAHQYEHLLLMHENQLSFDSQRLVINRSLKNFQDYGPVFKRSNEEGVGIVYYNSLIPSFVDEQMLKKALSNFRPSARVKHEATRFCISNQINEAVVGVHIRKTDFGDKVDDKALFDLIATSKQRHFVCSDDLGVNEKFSSLPNCCVFNKTSFPQKMSTEAGWQDWIKDESGREFPFNIRRPSEAVIEGLIDQLILSRTSIMNTSGSTFQQTAQLFGKVGFLPTVANDDEPKSTRASVGVQAPELFQLLDLIRPWQMRSKTKIRMGSLGDGGYVMPETSHRSNLAISIGIGDEVSFDNQLCAQGAKVLQFDHTIENTPSTHSAVDFYPLGWGTEDSSVFLTLKSMLKKADWHSARHPILKFDTEGAEWDCLDQVDSEDLAKFEVIAGEFHQFDRLPDREFFDRALRVFTKLNLTHRVVHLHANNAGGMVLISGVPFPRLLELTWVKIDKFTFHGHSNEPIPGPLDYPNITNLPDIHLRSF